MSDAGKLVRAGYIPGKEWVQPTGDLGELIVRQLADKWRNQIEEGELLRITVNARELLLVLGAREAPK